MNTDWPYDAGTSEIGDRPDEQLADREAGREPPPFEAPAAPMNIPAPRAGATARAEPFPDEQTVTDQLRSVRYWAERANVKSCWLCGIRLPADQMVADGASACLDLRWYCWDTWACTERWTSPRANPAAIGEGTAETPHTPGEQATDTEAARPVPVYEWPLTGQLQVTGG
jgi:hypothetical protein